MSRDITQRREWDSNPRWVAPHTLSKRADSAALASLRGHRSAGAERVGRGGGAVGPGVGQAIVCDARDRRWRPGPVQLQPVNRVRAGRQQLSAEPVVCRRPPGRHLGSRAVLCLGRSGACGAASLGTVNASALLAHVAAGCRPVRGSERGWAPVISPGVVTPAGSIAADGLLPVALPPLPAAAVRRGARPGPRHQALRNAVRDGRVGHAYLFSGPRGTGKTSTARILAKALNCDDARRRRAVRHVRVLRRRRRGPGRRRLLEHDAASNSKVDDMRDLLERVPLGTSGQRKVFILDEVHMLSQGAENALLKTLEEPPAHVVFVLATTDPQKVLPTIRSRTQHFEFRLLPPDVLADHVRHVIADAGLGPRRRRRRRGDRPRGPQRRRVGPRHPVGARPGGRARRGARRGRAGRRGRRRPRRPATPAGCWWRWPTPSASGRDPRTPRRGRHRRPARRLPLRHGRGRRAPGSRRAGAGRGRRRGARPGGADPGARRARRGADRAVPQARPPRRGRGRPRPAHPAGRRPLARRHPGPARPARTHRRRGRRTGGCGPRAGRAAGGSRWRSRRRRDALDSAGRHGRGQSRPPRHPDPPGAAVAPRPPATRCRPPVAGRTASPPRARPAGSNAPATTPDPGGPRPTLGAVTRRSQARERRPSRDRARTRGRQAAAPTAAASTTTTAPAPAARRCADGR